MIYSFIDLYVFIEDLLYKSAIQFSNDRYQVCLFFLFLFLSYNGITYLRGNYHTK